MNAVSLFSLVLAIVVLGVGIASWNSGGRRLALAAALVAAGSLMSVAWRLGDMLRYSSLALFASLVIVCVAVVRPATLRMVRFELLLACGATVAIGLSLFPGLGPVMLARTFRRFMAALRAGG